MRQLLVICAIGVPLLVSTACMITEDAVPSPLAGAWGGTCAVTDEVWGMSADVRDSPGMLTGTGEFAYVEGAFTLADVARQVPGIEAHGFKCLSDRPCTYETTTDAMAELAAHAFLFFIEDRGGTIILEGTQDDADRLEGACLVNGTRMPFELVRDAPIGTPIPCTNAVDDDGNGVVDCADTSCILADFSCRTVTTIPAIQSAIPSGAIGLNDLFVTAVSSDRLDLWVTETHHGPATRNHSIYVRSTGPLDAAIVVGDRLDLLGTASEYNDASGTETVTLVSLLRATITTDVDDDHIIDSVDPDDDNDGIPDADDPFTRAPSAPSPVGGVDVSMLDESFESVLVRLTDVKVTANGDPTSHVGQLVQGTTSFLSDDDIFQMPDVPLGTCFATITGIWTYQVIENAWALLPTGPGVGVGACP